jgi:hypothetical protein
VELVKSFDRMAKDLHSVVTYNSQAMQKVVDRIESNAFCPIVREKGRS